MFSLARVKDKYCVMYDSEEGNVFKVHKPDRMMRIFKDSRCSLYYMDIAGEEVGNVLITTIADKKFKYTKHDYSQAVAVCRLQNIIGHPSIKDYLWIMKNNILSNCPITVDDIVAAEDVSGPNLGSQKGKTVAQKGDPVEVKMEPILLPIM
jgi:hypothetical protein